MNDSNAVKQSDEGAGREDAASLNDIRQPDDRPYLGSLRGNKLFFPRPAKNLGGPKIKDVIRLRKYKKAMGLPDDMPFEEATKAINEYFDGLTPGLKFFEKTGSPIYGECLSF